MSNKRIHQLPAISGQFNPNFVFPVEHPSGTGTTQKMPISIFMDQLRDFMVSINGRLEVKEPVDFMLSTNVDLGSYPSGVDGKRYALNGQTDKTLNGVYQYYGGSFSIHYPSSYLDIYGPGSLFMDKSTGKLWFIPITKNHSNVIDTESGIFPNQAFNFLELERSMLSLEVLDKWEQSGSLLYNGGEGIAIFKFSGGLHRFLPEYILENYQAFSQAISYDLSTQRTPLVFDKAGSDTLHVVFKMENTTVTGDEDENSSYIFRANVSDSLLIDQIETLLTPLPDGSYYYASGS